MTPKILISYDGTENDHDALALGRAFAEAGASLSLAYIRHTHEPQQRREQLAQDEAEQMLARGAQWLGLDAERHVALSASTAAGLRTLALELGADMVVFGSEAHTAPGLVAPGTSARRLFEGGPVAVAVAPARLRDISHSKLHGIAIVGGDIDVAAHDTALSLAKATGTKLVAPSDRTLDLLVVGSRPSVAPGLVGISSASEYMIDNTRASVLVVARSTPLSFMAQPARGAAAPQRVNA